MNFIESLFVCFVLGICFFAAYGIVSAICLLVWKLRQRGKGKGYYAVGRCL